MPESTMSRLRFERLSTTWRGRPGIAHSFTPPIFVAYASDSADPKETEPVLLSSPYELQLDRLLWLNTGTKRNCRRKLFT